MAQMFLKVPDFKWSAAFYPEILDALVAWKRANVTELTDESEHDAAMQMLAAFSLVGHLASCRTDMAALEGMLRTAKLVESVRELLRLIGYEMRSSVPAKAEILYTLTAPLALSQKVVPAGARCATTDEANEIQIEFEADADIIAGPSLLFSAAFSLESGAYTDRTNAVNDIDPAFSVWATPEPGDMFFLGHTSVLWDRITTTNDANASGIEGVWEVYDGDWNKSRPDSVNFGGGQIDFVIDGYLSTLNRAGATIRVRLNSSQVYEDVVSFWDGVNNRVTTSYLGQPVPTTDPTAYTIGAEWEFVNLRPQALLAPSSITGGFRLPYFNGRQWLKTTINGIEAYWLRFRIVSTAVPVAPVVNHISMVDDSFGEFHHYVVGVVTQGLTQYDVPLGSGTGEPSQEFELSRTDFIDGSEEIAVDGNAWTRVKDFVNSGPADEHYLIRLGEDNRATVVFGPAGNGKPPPAGVDNVGAAYRYGAADDGNVGANTITVDRAGLTLVESITNPRQAVGWSEAQGASDLSLEQAKQLGPATLRTIGERAVSPDDVVTLALSLKLDDGSSPYARAWAIEEMFGAKTIGLVVVGSGGGVVPVDTINETNVWFNGDKFAIPPKPKRIVSNNEVVTVNYTPKVIHVHALVVTTGLTKSDLDGIAASIKALLSPTAVSETTTSVGWTWSFGDIVSLSRITTLIHNLGDGRITKVELTGWSDVGLAAFELPTAGDVTIEEV